MLKKEMVYQVLSQRILQGVIEPGSVLCTKSICEEFNISRTPLREAMVKLKQDGLIDIVPRKGAVVKGITARTIREFYELRYIFEAHAIEQLCSSPERDEICQKIKEILLCQENLKPEQKSEFIVLDDEFHWTLIKWLDNQRLNGLFKSIQKQLEEVGLKHLTKHTSAELALSQHWEIYEAIKKADSKKAKDALKHHLNSMKEILFLSY